MNETLKRYALDLDMYIHARNDNDAKEMASRIMDFLNIEFGGNASVKQLVEIQFGTFIPRNIEL